MLTKTAALVVHKIPHSDHSAVVRLFTLEHGLLPFLIQGLHGKQNKNAYYQPGQFLQVVYLRKNGSGLHRIREAQALHNEPLSMQPETQFWMQQLSSFALELLSLCLHEEHPEPDLFHCLEQHFQNLSHGKVPVSWFPLSLCLDMAEALGQSLPLQEGARKGGIDTQMGQWGHANSLPAHLISADECRLLREAQIKGQLNAPKMERLALLDKLIHHLSVCFFPGKSLKSIAVIRDLSA
ncbi:MAG: DNA repair protein RecO [Bacteroidia bacterium]